MEFYIYALMFFLIVVPLVLGIVIPLAKKHREVTGSVMNHDSAMRRFVYKVYMSEEEIVNALKEKNDEDEMWCDFDFDRSVITLSKYGGRQEYLFEIQACEGYSVLRLTQISVISGISPHKLNPFIVSKLNAEVVPFEQYKD